MYKNISEASQKIADISDEIIGCISEKEENKLLEELDVIIEAVKYTANDLAAKEESEIQNALNECFAKMYLFKINLRRKKKGQIRYIFPDATLEDIDNIIGIDGGVQSFSEQAILRGGSSNEMQACSIVDAMKKDRNQRQSWLARNAVTENEYMHYVRWIRNEIEQSTSRNDSISNYPQSARTNFSKVFSKEGMALNYMTYMDPNASKEEVDAILNMERGVLLFCEAQLAKGKMSLQQFIQEKHLTDVYKGKSREGHHEGPIHDMNCSNCSIM